MNAWNLNVPKTQIMATKPLSDRLGRSGGGHRHYHFNYEACFTWLLLPVCSAAASHRTEVESLWEV